MILSHGVLFLGRLASFAIKNWCSLFSNWCLAIAKLCGGKILKGAEVMAYKEIAKKNKTIKDGGIMGIINTFESSKSISSFEITLWPQYTCFIKDHISFWKCFWIIEDWGDLQNPYIHLKPHVADIKYGYCFPHSSPYIVHCMLGYSLINLLPLKKLSNDSQWFQFDVQ